MTRRFLLFRRASGIHCASDSADNGAMSVYRYKRGKETK